MPLLVVAQRMPTELPELGPIGPVSFDNPKFIGFVVGIAVLVIIMGCLCFRGCCCGRSGQTEKGRSDQVTIFLNTAETAESKRVKLLLLGTGSSGKSTIFKQMQILYGGDNEYGEKFSDFEKQTFKQVLRRNLVECIQTLIGGVHKFRVPFQTPGSTEAAARLMAIDSYSPNFWEPHIEADCIHLWTKEPAIGHAYQRRSLLLLLDSCSYLFTQIKRISHPDYVPTVKDILRARLRTSGIVERNFNVNHVDFLFLDVGGQRNERRKWIHCFSGVTAVIFLTAISEYDQVLFEDEKVNSLHESLNVWSSICNNRYFSQTAMIIFLNKIDLFREKINHVPLTTCFPDYTGPNDEENCARHIEDRFKELNQQEKVIFCHRTCATDTKMIERVFDDCRMVILKEQLQRLGLESLRS